MVYEPKSELVLSIDIGNSYTKIGIVSINNLECIHKSVMPSSAIATDFSEALDLMFKNVEPKYISRTVISSVVKSSFAEVEKKLVKKEIKNVIGFKYDKNLPVKINYKDPFTLGNDRVANLLYAQRAYPGLNCIVICAGTAIVTDLLRSNCEFSGGSILPGLDMQFRALHEFTDALPLVNYSEPISIPGKSTEECINAGVVYGTCGALMNIVNQYRLTLENSIVLASGGSWQRIASFVKFQHIYIPDMTLIGTALFGS
jgi:type III pantothenate kinase